MLLQNNLTSSACITFYARNAAFEQACYNTQITKAGKKFDLRYFVDLIVSEKERIEEWLIDVVDEGTKFMPIMHNLHALEANGAFV